MWGDEHSQVHTHYVLRLCWQLGVSLTIAPYIPTIVFNP